MQICLMDEKQQFIEAMKSRTKAFAISAISVCNQLDSSNPSKVISYQLIKSASSVGANYRAACKSRSGKEFYSKLCIVVEEADESEYWLELIQDLNLNTNSIKMKDLISEANHITRILTKSKNSYYNKTNK